MIDWYVQKYGALIDEHTVVVDGMKITHKIYRYDNRVFCETWCDWIRYSFCEVLGH